MKKRKMTIEYRYDGETYTVTQKSNGLSMCININADRGLIVNEDCEILFEFRADTLLNIGYLVPVKHEEEKE